MWLLPFTIKSCIFFRVLHFSYRFYRPVASKGESVLPTIHIQRHIITVLKLDLVEMDFQIAANEKVIISFSPKSSR